MQSGGPAGMIDGYVDKNFGIALMNSVNQFDELFQRRGMRIKLRQSRVDGRKAQSGVRAAESSHAPVGCRCGVDRQQQKDTASELTDYKIKLPDQIAKGS